MVSGKSDRERLAADARRLKWLADARFGPNGMPPTASEFERRDARPGRWRGGLTAALLLGQRIRLRPDAGAPLPAAPRPDWRPLFPGVHRSPR